MGRVLRHSVYIHFRGLLPPNRILPGAKFTLRPSLAFSYIGSVTARHSSSGHQPVCSVVQGMELRNFRRARHLYSAGRPSRWASAHTHSINSALVLLQASADVSMKNLSLLPLFLLRIWGSGIWRVSASGSELDLFMSVGCNMAGWSAETSDLM